MALLLAVMEGETVLLARLLCGTGMGLMEDLRLRVKDFESDCHVIKAGSDATQSPPGGMVA